mmetsp:Transcript_34213/g.85654  ORF Transcript_34213/g.85654 Transcript_34213/m.85654 type:complete len:214 (-) Transcript_34213:335-976(-)
MMTRKGKRRVAGHRALGRRLPSQIYRATLRRNHPAVVTTSRGRRSWRRWGSSSRGGGSRSRRPRHRQRSLVRQRMRRAPGAASPAGRRCSRWRRSGWRSRACWRPAGKGAREGERTEPHQRCTAGRPSLTLRRRPARGAAASLPACASCRTCSPSRAALRKRWRRRRRAGTSPDPPGGTRRLEKDCVGSATAQQRSRKSRAGGLSYWTALIRR